MTDVSFPQLLSAIAGALDLISPALNNHHKQVAYISHELAEMLDLPAEKRPDLMTAALFHDIGALDLDERIELLEFEEADPYRHTISGHVLLDDLEIFKKAGEIIKHHHLPWAGGEGRACRVGRPVHPESHLIYLADRIAVLIDHKTDILKQAEGILRRIKGQAGSRFDPRFVEAFAELSEKKDFWLNLESAALDEALKLLWDDLGRRLKLEELLEVTRIFARIIDSKSRFTSLHSSGVAAVAEAIASKMNWPAGDLLKIKIAGNLHDLGKLSIPTKILEKRGKLTPQEYEIMKTHAYYSYHLLSKVDGLQEINEYASLHHERLNGQGYPFKLKGSDLKEGSRIMAAADVLTAITEKRPYREGMGSEEALQTIEKMGRELMLDEEIAALVGENFAEINDLRIKTQEQAAKEYLDIEEKTRRVRDLYC